MTTNSSVKDELDELEAEYELDELEAEYDFDYSKARPNRFAKLIAEDSLMVVLDPDVAKVFTSTKKVNDILRAIIRTMSTVAVPSEAS